MVYNVWNDPEREIIEAAIVRFVDDISDEDIDALFDTSFKQYNTMTFIRYCVRN